MRRLRAGLLIAGAAFSVTLAFSPTLSAQLVAPTLTGESGLFELTNADSLPQGRFSFGLFFSQWDREAAPSLLYGPGADDPLRYGVGKIGLSVGFGMLPNWEVTVGSGQRTYYADTREWAGVVNGRERQGGFKHSETDKIRIGTKVVLNQKAPDLVKVALFGGFAVPTQTRNDRNALSTYRADWDFGISGTYKVATFQASYLNTGDLGEDFDVANEFRWGIGFNLPVIPHVLHAIAEINRIHYDGGTTKPGDFSEVLAGARLGLGQTGLTASGALRVNIDRWVKYGSRPSNIGGLLQIAYSPVLGNTAIIAVPAAATAPEPAPAATMTTTTTEVTKTAIEPPPASRPETSTTDEILFDSSKSRLTNIAKAILDGVALRLKNNLAATCTVVSYTDPKEKGGDHASLARARSDAAKDYLIKRHGIDAARIRIEAKGDMEAGSDGTRNRRAVITVTFP